MWRKRVFKGLLPLLPSDTVRPQPLEEKDTIISNLSNVVVDLAATHLSLSPRIPPAKCGDPCAKVLPLEDLSTAIEGSSICTVIFSTESFSTNQSTASHNAPVHTWLRYWRSRTELTSSVYSRADLLSDGVNGTRGIPLALRNTSLSAS